MAVERFQLELTSSRMLTPYVRHLGLKRTDDNPLHFEPGQFITFLFDHEDGKVRRRSYSIATIPGSNNEIEIAVAYVADGIATEHLFHMQEGDCYNAMGPAGKLILKNEPVSRLVLVGTGTGIAPYRAMLPQLAERIDNDNIEVVVLLGVQYRKDALYADDFLHYSRQYDNFHFIACYSQETTDLEPHEREGYVQTQFEKLGADPQEDIFYLCGNPNMIDDAYERLLEKGFGNRTIRREKYISSN